MAPYDDTFITLKAVLRVSTCARMTLIPISLRTMTHPTSTARRYEDIVLNEVPQADGNGGW
jgi:hypothetical protein